ncbi:hypothetical protein [uncultured Ilyobacter sp.]|uniref:hypothetical protein n=1 Tax=uncultured Ilyobacter sp. TaxID=544433 RepID=UPI0029C0CCC8|nr:hypothetical protein [uncultured Ilyobacter sp.]
MTINEFKNWTIEKGFILKEKEKDRYQLNYKHRHICSFSIGEDIILTLMPSTSPEVHLFSLLDLKNYIEKNKKLNLEDK